MEKSRAIDSHTILYGVFGDPIRHSRSPIMLNRAFQEADINAVYAAFHVRPDALGDAVRGIRALGYRGINVTIPHKVEVMQYLDEIDEGARIVGAVNTIVNENGKLIGYNTDGIGYVRSLKEETGIDLKGKSVLVLGAGGAARGVAYALAKEGAGCIYIANRTKERALELAETISAFTKTVGLGLDEIANVVDEVQFVLNTTSAGMHPNTEELPMPVELLKEHHLVSDLIYNPRITRFLREAEAKGARIHGGLGMFIYQGAFAFEYWTGKPAPVAAMRQVVEQSLAE
ncbi:shikimate dehydrogenase [Paenibacillus sp. CGMCC 1.16610]|uniref:Shikimate dehydrogenase (NADP(+)) n=1 Tax=Paenibacillus anseongense TaxID=2682845 RepID=A0ABW9UAX4_9BACL|nr:MULTISPECIES: shikimate dehydrogenase [Paenibacillus]MBA2938229.1 shikimate dehydrogenase [Paenibacillus sp. CGMCC 1.16610]MVQ37287.1 shikimate dehydrogenase [Paenibacillus anseongense]